MAGVDLPFDVIAVAVAAVLVLYFLATRQAVEPFAQSLADNVPLIGGAIAGALTSIVDGVRNRVGVWVDDGATPIAHALAAPPIALSALGRILIALLAAMVQAIQGTATSATQNAVNAIGGTLGAVVATLQGQVSTLIDLAIPALQTNINFIGAEGLRLYQEAQAQAATAIDGLRSDIEQRLAAVAAAASADIDALWQRTLAQVAGIEAGIAGRIDQAMAAVRAEVQSLIGSLNDRVGAVEGAVEQTVPGLIGRVGTLEGELVGVTDLAQTTAATLTKEITECIDPLCDNIKPEIPNIRAAIDLLELGILATLITDAIVEPIPAAHRTDALVVGPADTVLNALLAPIGTR